MANWTWNEVMVYGSEVEIRHFKTFVKGYDSPFDFNRILPLPAELKGTTAPSRQPNQRLLDLYGADNWYDWRIQNWGTKWNAGSKPLGIPALTPNEQIRVTQTSECHLEYSFFTPSSPPVGIYETLCGRFADRDLQLAWHFAQDPCEGERGFLQPGGGRMWPYQSIDYSGFGSLATWNEDTYHEQHIPWEPQDDDFSYTECQES